VALLLGVVTPPDVVTVWGIIWNATITFVAIIITSMLLDEAGFFEWAALHVASWGRGSGPTALCRDHPARGDGVSVLRQ
jgi:arsenical pump membrane protein